MSSKTCKLEGAMSKCLLIDGNNIVFRAYYAFARQNLKTSKNEPTGALYGFLRMLLKMIHDERPDYLAVAFDTSRDTFRKEMYPEYKAKRKPVPEDLLIQLPLAQKAVEALSIKVLKMDGFEADDLIGSVTQSFKTNNEVSIVTGDRDLLQLIEENVTVRMCKKGVSEIDMFDKNKFYETYGFEPIQIIDFKALMGDSSDNIPGVKGIGEKKALPLIQQFNTIENLYDKIELVANEKNRQKLLDDKQSAFLSKQLATIKLDIECFKTSDELACDLSCTQSESFAQFLQRWEFGSLYKEFTGNQLPVQSQYNLPETDNKLKPLGGEKILITELSELEEFIDTSSEKELICIDLETDGFSPIDNKIVGVSICFEETKAIYIPIRHAYLGITQEDQIAPEKLFEVLSKVLKNRTLIGHNLKFDMAFLQAEGVDTNHKIFDTLIAAYVIDPVRSNSLKNLGMSLLGFEVKEYKDVAGSKSFSEVNVASATEYACQDTLLTMKLYRLLVKELQECTLTTKLFHNIEMPLVSIILEMEKRGTGLDTKYLKDLSKEITIKISLLEKSIHQLANREFNINSTKQLQEVLFNELKLKPPKKTKTGFSTDSEVLSVLASEHEICSKLLEYRELAKLQSTYTESLSKLVSQKTGLLHASFNQAVTATGRLSSSNPNMQNIPIRSQWGKKIRRAFVPPIDGESFLSIDYSQIELRLLAHFSMDEGLIDAYNKGTDIHSLTAAKIFKCEIDQVTKEQRNVGKTVNFGILYGISAHGLAEDLAISRYEAKEYIDNFYNSYKSVTDFFDTTVKQARETMQVETLLGRTRRLENINAKGFQARSGAERIAKNTRLQGSAADLVKKAMIDTTTLLKEQKLKTSLILQIHDELVFSVPESEKDLVPKLLKECMEKTVKLNVPLVCDCSIGPNLADLESID